MKYQGKRKDQVNFSNLMVMSGMVGIGLTLILTLPFLFKTNSPTEIKPTHEYWLPGGDTTQINDTLSYSDE